VRFVFFSYTIHKAGVVPTFLLLFHHKDLATSEGIAGAKIPVGLSQNPFLLGHFIPIGLF
jgi:hypothetical protein